MQSARWIGLIDQTVRDGIAVVDLKLSSKTRKHSVFVLLVLWRIVLESVSFCQKIQVHTDSVYLVCTCILPSFERESIGLFLALKTCMVVLTF